MIFAPDDVPPGLSKALTDAYRADETAVLQCLLSEATLPSDAVDRIAERARALVRSVRAKRVRMGGIDAFLHEYELSSQEGVVLMCLAEALLRIPDAETADRLIRDKIGHADWERHLAKSDSVLVNASTWALMLTGRILKEDSSEGWDLGGLLKRMLARGGEPVIRESVRQAMRIMGKQFVMGRTIEEALARAAEDEPRGYRHSYDMLGEGARTMADADRYMASYRMAIDAIGGRAAGRGPVDAPGISVKLSAIHPRYELAQRKRALAELTPRLVALCQQAKRYGIGLTVDAEESERLEISFEILAAVAADPSLAGWDGLGLALQAYSKRAFPAIEWLEALARRTRRRLMVRLVKGAYWDTEVKRTQERGLDGYPVFTRKASTDLSYIACAKRLLAAGDAFYPMFATHNAHTVAAVHEMAGNRRDFEFQRLHGMGAGTL